MSKTKKEATKDSTKVEAVKITSAEQLQGLIDAPIECAFQLDGRALVVELVRLKPKVLDEVRALGRLAQPKWSEARKDYDYLDGRFLAEREKNSLIGRAVALYAGCPIIAGAKPGLVSKEDIFTHVQGMFSEVILGLLHQTLTGEGVSLDERVNFSSTAGSAQS